MINYETILSNYDDRLTLMQWLKKVEAALMAAALASVTITQPSDDTAVFNFVFADGTSVSSPSLNLPRGPQGEQGTQGEQGAQGVGVSNVTINSNSHLIVTLTNGVEIDAGYIETGSGIVVDTELSPTSANPVENRVIYNVVTTAQNTISALGGRVTTAEGKITTAEGNISALDTRVTTAEGAITTLQNDKLEKVTAADVDSENATSGQVLTANGSGGASWQTPQGGGAIAYEGTSLLPEGVVFEDWTLHRAIKDGNILWITLAGVITNTTSSTKTAQYIYTITLPSSISNKIYRADGSTCDINAPSTATLILMYNGTANQNSKPYSVSSEVANVLKLKLVTGIDIAVNSSARFDVRIPIFLDIGTVQS